MNFDHIVVIVMSLVSLVFAIVLHEVAHGYAAYRMGDPTAAYSKRLTLNPLAHVDLFGSIILPLILVFTSPVVLGWAKPVPINPYHFRNLKKGIMIVGAAGPLTNFALALLSGLLCLVVPMSFDLVKVFLVIFCVTNANLAVFNMIPIPPLDGSRVLYGLLPRGMDDQLMGLEKYGIFIIFGLLYIGALDRIIIPVSEFVKGLLLGGHY